MIIQPMTLQEAVAAVLLRVRALRGREAAAMHALQGGLLLQQDMQTEGVERTTQRRMCANRR